MGPKGLRYSVGPTGSYMTTGIPGTGLSVREKIGAASHARSHGSLADAPAESKTNLTLRYDEATREVTVLDQDGKVITDLNLLQYIRAQDPYKEGLLTINKQVKQDIDEKTRQFLEIYKATPKMLTAQDWQSFQQAKPIEYDMQPFPDPEPTKEGIKEELWQRARNEIGSLFFWRNSGLRETFVSENLDRVYTERHNDWAARKAAFDAEEYETKQSADTSMLACHNEHMARLGKALNGDGEYIRQAVEDILKGISLPVEFAIDFDYDEEKRRLHIDLDLPEIEQLPIEQAGITATGRLSVKQKSAKGLRSDYAVCVTGLAFYFAGHFFNISPMIGEVVVSGYTQRLSKKTGNIENEYIYSVQFIRDIFQRLNIAHINPIDAFENFTHTLELNQSFEFKAIVPLE